MAGDELQGLVHLLLHEGGLANAEESKNFARAGDVVGPDGRMIVVVLVVPREELITEIRAQRYEAVKYHVVAHGPGHAAENCAGGRERRPS